MLGVACALAAVVVGVADSASAADDVATPVTFAIADDAAQRAFPSELTSARSAGIGAARAYVGWAEIASRRPVKPRDPSDHAYDWAQTDADMARYGGAGLAVWIAFWRTPAWASGSLDSAVWPADPKDLEDFAFAVARRYPQVSVFMDWNEPNLKAYAKPNTIEAYEPMARAVYAGVKAAHPSAEVIAANLARYRDNGRDPAAWAATLRADGVPMDAFGIHPYPDVSKPLAGRSPRARIDLFDVPALARLAGVPVAVTEFGWSSQLAGEANQATWTAHAIAVARCTPGLSEFVFWGYHDHPVPAGQTPDPWVRYGWLDAAGVPKPVAAAAHAALTGTPDCSTVAQADGAPAGWPDTSTIAPADTAPACTDVALSSSAGAGVSADLACTDADGDALSYVVTAAPVNGTISQAGSLFTYVPGAGFRGDESLIVSARDGVYSTPIRVSISVTAPAPSPLPLTPEAQSLETAPAAAAVAPAIAAPVARRSTAAIVHGSRLLRDGSLSITLPSTTVRWRRIRLRL